MVKQFKTLCMQNQVRKFDTIFNLLNERSKKLVAEGRMEGTQVIGGSEVSVRRQMTFAQWIARKPAERWAWAHDTTGAR